MNNDLIIREALKELISDKLDERFRWDSKLTVCEFKTIVGDIIDNAPTVDLSDFCGKAFRNGEENALKIRRFEERPQGEWIVDEDNDLLNFMKCSNCGEVAEWLDGGSQFLSKFCPNCGAQMKGGAV